jgi:2,3-bisphosphoglycerate-dependent phosphoglycerate mutase
MPTLVLLRHGQSLWNLEDRFTGWVDVDLSPLGEVEAKAAGELIASAGVALDRVFASVLTRAIRTADIALAAAGQLWIPMEKSWRLNERHYGGLTGLNKAETAERHGAAEVKAWRRSYDTPPPSLEPGGPYDLSADRRYAGVAVPATETLKSTLERVRPYWRDRIAPALTGGERVIIAAHGNSLRAIVKLLFAVSDEAIPAVEIPTGNPLLVALDAELRPRQARYLDEARAQPLPRLKAQGAA